jgi:hypothetical protein
MRCVKDPEVLGKTDSLLAQELVRRAYIEEQEMERIQIQLQAQSGDASLLGYLQLAAQAGRLPAELVRVAEELEASLRFAASDVKEAQPRIGEVPAITLSDSAEAMPEELWGYAQKTAEPESVDISADPDPEARTENNSEAEDDEDSANGSGVRKKRRRRRSGSRAHKKKGSGVRKAPKRGRRRKSHKEAKQGQSDSASASSSIPDLDADSGEHIDFSSLPRPAPQAMNPKRDSGVKKRASSAIHKRSSVTARGPREELPIPLIAGIGGLLIAALCLLTAMPGGNQPSDPEWTRSSPKRRVARGPLVSDQPDPVAKRNSGSREAGSSKSANQVPGAYQEIRKQAEHGDYTGALAAIAKLPMNPNRVLLREELESLQAQAVRSGIEVAEASARRGEFARARRSFELCRKMGGDRFKAAIDQKLRELALLSVQSKRADALEELVDKGQAADVWKRLADMNTTDGPLLRLKRRIADILIRQALRPIYDLANAGQLTAALAALRKLQDGDPALSLDQFQIHQARLRRAGGLAAAPGDEAKPNSGSGPVAGSRSRTVHLTYKDDFHELQASASRSAEAGVLEAELVAVMKRSLALLGESPEMAYDVCHFYHGRRAFIKKNPALVALLEAHNKAAFEVIVPTACGPAAFKRLANFCQRVGYKQGTKELAPMLARLRSPNPSNSFARQHREMRLRQSRNRTELRRFVRKSKVKVIEDLRELLAWLKLRKLRSDSSDKDFADLVDKLCRQLNQDSKLAAELLSEFRSISRFDHSQEERALLLKDFSKRKAQIIDGLEGRMLKAVKQALGAKEAAMAYDLLRNALIVKPGSDRVYRGLLHKKIDGQWIRPWAADKRARGLKYDAAIGWYSGLRKEGHYYDLQSNSWRDLASADKRHSAPSEPWVFDSEHFTLISTASREQSLNVERRLEAFYLQIFRQLDRFFSPSGNPRKVFGLDKGLRHTVQFYRNRQQYLDHSNPPAQWSAGFWSGGRRSSFFYSTGSWTVLQHEIVHQILGESSSGHPESWLAEGIAVYLENADFNDSGQLVLGSLDKHRRPYAYHLQAQRGSVSIRFNEVLALKTNAQWGAGAITDHYMGAGALVYFFMNFDGGRYRNTFLDFLRSCYSGGVSSSLSPHMDLSNESLEWLFDRFYKSGFCNYHGQTITWEQRAEFDLELIARRYPDPRDRAAKAADRAAPINAALESAKRSLRASRAERRRAGFTKLGEAGEEGLEILKTALPELVEQTRSSFLKTLKSQRSSFQKSLAAVILRRRKAAHSFIMDPQKYPNANHGRAAQPTVDKLVASLKAAFNEPLSVLLVKSRTLQGLNTKLKDYTGWCAELGIKDVNYVSIISALKVAYRDKLNMARVILDSNDGKLKRENAPILAANEAQSVGMNVEELDACRATNEYRILFGLRALRYSAGLARAARGHSEEMEKLNYFSHSSPTPQNRTPEQRCQREGARYSAENIAQGQHSGRAAVDGWLHSSGHHRNILGKGHQAVGLGQAGRLWTQCFGSGA